jgi:hypothetical protein
MSTAWTARYALRTKSITTSAIRELLKIALRPGMISFAGGLPVPDVSPHIHRVTIEGDLDHCACSLQTLKLSTRQQQSC